ncbi:MAG: RepB family DNA primase [Candidatus Thiodiazotropha taylori]|nr:RepB family DNA primase [Candidatus Thiodiazotropha taylori]
MKRRFQRDPCVSHLTSWILQTGRELKPDRQQAESFLQALDAEDRPFSFRTFSDSAYTRSGSEDPLEKALHGSLADCWESLVQLNSKGAVITATINQTNGTGRSVEDICRVRAIFIDDDLGVDVERFTVQPHIQVETSPDHYHYYWRVEDLPLSEFQTCQQRLARLYHGDSRVQALNQSMQIPGFWRRKRLSHPRLPRIMAISEAPPLDQRLVEKLVGG